MTDLEDVNEYVRDELKRQAVITIDVRRLLKYIKRFGRPETQRQSVAMVYMHLVCLTIVYPMFTLTLPPSRNTFRIYAPLLHARHNTESSHANCI